MNSSHKMLIALCAIALLHNNYVQTAQLTVAARKNIVGTAVEMLRQAGDTSMLISKTKLAIGAVVTAIVAGTAGYFTYKKVKNTEQLVDKAKREKEAAGSQAKLASQSSALTKEQLDSTIAPLTTQMNAMQAALQQQKAAASVVTPLIAPAPAVAGVTTEQLAAALVPLQKGLSTMNNTLEMIRKELDEDVPSAISTPLAPDVVTITAASKPKRRELTNTLKKALTSSVLAAANGKSNH